MGECIYKSTFFLTSALVGGGWSASLPCRFTPEERAPRTRWIGGWIGPRVGLDDVEKIKFLTLQELELRPLSRPARSQSLCRLRSWTLCSFLNPVGVSLAFLGVIKSFQRVKLTFSFGCTWQELTMERKFVYKYFLPVFFGHIPSDVTYWKTWQCLEI
jgi:hypothetical protein